jgi:hypothetical protein
MQAQTIDEVISRMEAIISHSIKTNSRAGYFAALYYKVTCRVKQGIQAGEFEDGARMEQFDVTFANRYLAAYDEWVNKMPVTSQSWKVAFDALTKPTVLVLQHLLLGMNAHINLDLGVAVVELAKTQNRPLQDLHNDFNTINTILAALTYQVINELDQVSPLLSLAGLHSNNDSLFIQFAMNNARDGAWCFAEDLYPRTDTSYTDAIIQRDKDIYQLGGGIIEVKGLLKITVFIIYLFGYKNPAGITEVLNTYKKTYLKVRKS